VHARDGVQERRERVTEVLRQLARGGDIDAEVVITASHSRTYRSSSSAVEAISSLVAAGISAMTSNNPVRWPTLTIRASEASFIVRSIRSANSSANLTSRRKRPSGLP